MTVHEIRSWAKDAPVRTFYEHPRLGEQEVPEGLMALLASRRLFRNVRWQEYVPDDQADREPADDLGTAEAASSMRAGAFDRHAILFDIDMPATLVGGIFTAVKPDGSYFGWHTQGAPAWLVPSTQENHWHLYVDCDLPQDTMFRILGQFERAGVVEPGYAQVSRKRGFTALRLPWVSKEDAATALEPVDEAIDGINAIIAGESF